MTTKRFVDLSIAIESDLPSDPPVSIPKIEYISHEQGAEQMLNFFPGLEKEQLPKNLGWAIENLYLTTHAGTHLDAPFHYHPTMDNGKRSLTVDEIPLDWCFSDGVVLDFRDKADGYRIEVKDLENELRRINYTIKPLDIVLIHTGADVTWGTPQYLDKGCGMGKDSTLFLLNQGVKVVGIDAWSWDRPLSFMARDFAKNGTPDLIWEAHFAGIQKSFCHMEKLTNLGEIGRPYGFTIACFPVKIKDAGAGWTRTVAIVED